VRSSSSVIERSEGPTARSPLRLLPSCCLGAVSPNWRRRASSRFLMYATAFWSFLSLRNQEITQSRHHGRVRAGRRGRSHTAHGSAITFRLERSHVFGHLAGEVEGIRDGALVLPGPWGLHWRRRSQAPDGTHWWRQAPHTATGPPAAVGLRGRPACPQAGQGSGARGCQGLVQPHAIPVPVSRTGTIG
jgi:hypothetical protein